MEKELKELRAIVEWQSVSRDVRLPTRAFSIPLIQSEEDREQLFKKIQNESDRKEMVSN